MEIQVGALFRLFAQAVLADENKGREEDRLQGYNHCQQAVREWVKNLNPEMARVQ
jgi:hypothetical protein